MLHNNPKYALDKKYQSVGNVVKVRSIGQLPRGRKDFYNARRSAPSEVPERSEDGSAMLQDKLWNILVSAKRKERVMGKVFVLGVPVHPKLSAVLGSDRQLSDLE